VQGYPDLRFIAKCLIDDGSYEANIFFYDQTVVNLLRIPKETLKVSHVNFRKFSTWQGVVRI
jgi:hypothetical protein